MVDSDIKWKLDIIRQIHERNRFEIDCFADLILYNHKLVEGTTSLRDENIQLTIENEKLRKDCKEGVASTADQEKIQALEQKVLLQQEELTSLHKRRGEHTQQLVDLNAALQDRDKLIAERDNVISDQKATISKLKIDVNLYQLNFRELEGLNQTIRDEHTALQLAFAALEEKLRQAQNENRALVNKLMNYKSKDADRLNEENESFVRKKQAAILKDLEEAAKESGGTASPEKWPIVHTPVPALPTCPSLKIDAHDSEVNAVRWSPVDRILATGGSDRRVKLWDVSRGMYENIGMLTGSNAGVMSVDFDSTGTLILAASLDFACRVWTVSDRRLRVSLHHKILFLRIDGFRSATRIIQ
ncbi:UNVERIFIED_CONTAM: hypothetical protein PYX00_002668 [Menopon gallinae]|uniref:Autophagy-related protein 16 domain-containing protein n=1 Tax=Menopon gallinae TaxID=328185 RepID=A0AAW2HYQ1_9NEOP